jgi:Protein of unknown function (DUF2778)
VKLRWIFTGLAAAVAILAAGFVLSLRETRGVASSAMAAAPAERPTVRALAQPEPGGLTFADRFAGVPLWDTAYTTVRTETRAAYASPQPSDRADGVTTASTTRAPTFQLASASATMATPSAPSESRPRPTDIASAVAAFSEPDSRIAIYDIAAHTVYMPNGDKLEAHSGLGDRLDNPRFVSAKNRGPTPPNVYKLSLRERVFHGVRAIRLTPVDESKMFGRDGMLAHTYMLRARGHSNGCVVFGNYPVFLNAFLRGEVDRLVVVDHLEAKPKANSKVASAAP